MEDLVFRGEWKFKDVVDSVREMKSCGLPQGDSKEREETPGILRCLWRCRNTGRCDLSSWSQTNIGTESGRPKGETGKDSAAPQETKGPDRSQTRKANR